MSDATQAIGRRILRDRGYVVMAFSPGPLPLPKVGEVIDRPLSGGVRGGEFSGPFRVIAKASADEWITQAEDYCGLGDLARASASLQIGFFRLKRAKRSKSLTTRRGAA